ncbi:MAG: hypothetical protein GXO47_01655 [Chlorobi bacterium]|nr:hypothetical protein [Chlorobiota bacterium]
MTKQEATDKINKQLEGIPRAEIRAVNLSVLPRLVGALNERSATCSECAELHDQSLSYVNDVVKILRGPSAYREKFEAFVTSAFMHLNHDHYTVPKGRILSVSVLTGMLLGFSFAILLSYFFENKNMIGYGTLGWVIGVTGGYAVGKFREKQLKKENRLF